MPPGYELELFKSALTLIVAALSLAATWMIGQRLTVYWNLRQRRNELNQVSLQAFHALYGEFKEGIKIWRLAKRPLRSPVLVPLVPEDERWKLLARACAIESKSEALVLRLTTERFLSPEEIRELGLFRQAIQTLRESIRDNVDCPLGSRKTEYMLLNQLAPRIASIVSADVPKRIPCTKQAQDQLAEVVRVTSKHWKQKVAEMQSLSPAIEEDDEDA